jgi:hypothetical protein
MVVNPSHENDTFCCIFSTIAKVYSLRTLFALFKALWNFVHFNFYVPLHLLPFSFPPFRIPPPPQMISPYVSPYCEAGAARSRNFWLEPELEQ